MNVMDCILFEFMIKIRC